MLLVLVRSGMLNEFSIKTYCGYSSEGLAEALLNSVLKFIYVGIIPELSSSTFLFLETFYKHYEKKVSISYVNRKFPDQPAYACSSILVPFIHQGPVVQSIVSLTSSLRVVSLTVLADPIYSILKFFADKM